MKSPLALIFLTVAIDLIGFGMIVPLLPLYAEHYGADGVAVAFLFAAYSLMQFICAPLWGALSDRVGRRPVLLASIAGNVFALLLLGWAPSYAWLLAARLLAGLCTANISVANAYVADVTGPADRAKGMGLIGAAFGIGFVIGPFFGGELSAWGYQAPALAAAALSTFNCIGAFFWLPESLPQAQRRPAHGTADVWRTRLASWRSLTQVRGVLALVFVQILGFSMLEMALVLFAHRRLGFDARYCGRIFAYIGVIMVIVQGGLIGRLTRRWGERRVAIVGLGSSALGLLFLPVTPPHAWWILLGCVTFTAVGQGFTGPALSSLLSRGVSPHRQGEVLGLSQSLSALARVVGPQSAGLLFDLGGENLPFYVGGIVMLAAWAVALGRLTHFTVSQQRQPAEPLEMHTRKLAN